MTDHVMKAVEVKDPNEAPHDQKFEDETFDMGPHPCCKLACGCKDEFHFGDQVMHRSSICCFGCNKIERDFPYAELSGVGPSKECGCCAGVVGVGDGPENPVLQPGAPCCCQHQLVNDFVAAVKERIKGRGDMAQLAISKKIASDVAALNVKVDAIMRHLNLPAPVAPVTMG